MAAKAVARKTFTPASARKALPLVRMIAQDVVQLHRELAERQARLAEIRSRFHRRDQSTTNPYLEELEQADADLLADRRRLDDFRDELQELGVELRDQAEGQVEFPAVMDNSKAWLRWQVGQDEVTTYRLADDAADVVRLLPAGSAPIEAPPSELT